MNLKYTKTLITLISTVILCTNLCAQKYKEPTKAEVQRLIKNEHCKHEDNLKLKSPKGVTKVKVEGVVFFDRNQDSIYNDPTSVFSNAKLLIFNVGVGTYVYDTITTSNDGFYRYYIEEPGYYELRLLSGPDPGFDVVTETRFFITVKEGDQNNYTFNIGFSMTYCSENAKSGSLCETAPLLCNLKQVEEFCSGLPLMEGALSGHPFCPDGGIFNNSSWYQFVAGTGNYYFMITPFDCSPGGGGVLGMHAAIFSSCDDLSAPIICFSDFKTEPFTVPTNALTPGLIYYFVLDGAAGSICNYTITVRGDYTPFSLSYFNNYGIELKEQYTRCQFEPLISLKVDLVDNVESLSLTEGYNYEYIWVVTNPIKKGGFTLQNQFNTQSNTFEYYMEEQGEYEVCLHLIRDYCDELETKLCKKFRLSDQLSHEDLGEVELTADYFPYTGSIPDIKGFLPIDRFGNHWLGNAIQKKDILKFPQTFTSVVKDKTTSCSYIQELKVKAFFNEISIYPNPVLQTLGLHIDDALHITSYKIVNHLGKLELLNTNFVNGLDRIDISSLPVGLYTIQFTTSEGTIPKRFEKKR